ncbi:uncharacterized protein LOC106465768 [Limulus polyphemus]|uniref:Uncharacterized protein LOC106465768 n=1 Tax=Limulus polyphemus TaxID=6850 RepID=A0ABM1T0K5_LIMPO|nr:uncharacterized protein LOC106465768 [Limulus polyphemus]XP_013781456.1 uncharacterized protein LOC106465768 [Limulus polyphemus]XP_013781457.1 uncharacterized protein LOC106465768 [Limulus polyphemus]XP_022249409.1 uncharacterized protein LOC106465768 [Limulus polyphemus]XP_022249411.1 uncharacterized protein LOC106465768 [Limulus polyphemus]
MSEEHQELNSAYTTVSVLPVQETTEEDGSRLTVWSPSMTKLLITLRRANDRLFVEGLVTKKKAWDLIAKKATEVSGVVIGGEQCCNKWKKIEKKYREVKENQGKPVEDKNIRIDEDFCEEMEEIMENEAKMPRLCKKTNQPSTSQASDESEDEDSNFTVDESCEYSLSALANSKRKRKRTTATEIVQALEMFRKERKKDEEDRMKRLEQMHKERMQLLEKLVTAITKT